MNGIKSREPREEVRISVRFVADAGWADAEIQNVSSSGLMAVSPCPPSQGSYVEIRREGYSIVGRVVWSSSNSFGLQAREKIVLAELARPRPQREARSGERRKQPERREAAALRRPDFAEQAHASARYGRAFEFVVVSTVVGIFAYLVADQAGDVLGAPLLKIRETLVAASAR